MNGNSVGYLFVIGVLIAVLYLNQQKGIEPPPPPPPPPGPVEPVKITDSDTESENERELRKVRRALSELRDQMAQFEEDSRKKSKATQNPTPRTNNEIAETQPTRQSNRPISPNRISSPADLGWVGIEGREPTRIEDEDGNVIWDPAWEKN